MTKPDLRGFLNELEDMCECSICCNEYENEERIPRVLPCMHTFCSDCLSKQCRRHKLKCPMCNQEYNVKNGNIQRFPKDYTRRQLKETLEKFSKNLCKECQKLMHVQYVCKTCNVHMCRICYNMRKMGTCSRHDVEKLEDFSSLLDFSSNTTNTPDPSTNICHLSGHENNELKFFCSESLCCIAICANCVVEFHKDHTIKPIAIEYVERKKDMLMCCHAARDKIRNVEMFLHNIHRNRVLGTKTGFKEKTNQIEKDEKIGKTTLNVEAEKTYIAELQMYMKMLERREEQIQSFIENATECCAISEEAISLDNITAFLSVEKTLKAQLKSFVESDVDRPLDIMPKASDFNLQNSLPELEIDQTVGKRGKSSGGNLMFLKRCWKCLSVKTRTTLQQIFSWNVLLSFFVGLFLYVYVFLKLYPVPFSHVFATDHTELALHTHQSSLICYSKDNRRISNMPFENLDQTCGNGYMPYILRGVFTKTVLEHENGKRIVFKINVSRVKKYTPGLVLFEFGVSTGAVERRSILGSPSSDFFGWLLKVLNSAREVALINTEGRVVKSSTISVFDEASYVYSIELHHNRTIVLQSKNSDDNSYIFLDETRSIKGNSLFGFAKVCQSFTAHVTVMLTESNMTFNRTTLYPNLYIAVDNRTFSNIPQSSLLSKFIQKNTEENIFQDIMLLNCTKQCVYVLKFRVTSPTANDVFTLSLTNSQFLPSASYNITLFTYTRCSYTYFVTYESFCFLIYRNNSTFSNIPMVPNTWHSVSIVVNPKQNSASIMFGKHVMDIQDINIFGQGTPILRSVFLTVEDSVEIHLADSDEFDILTWFIYEFTNYGCFKNFEGDKKTIYSDTEKDPKDTKDIFISDSYQGLGTIKR